MKPIITVEIHRQQHKIELKSTKRIGLNYQVDPSRITQRFTINLISLFTCFIAKKINHLLDETFEVQHRVAVY